MAFRRSLILLGLLAGCHPHRQPWTEGVASWYGPGFRGKPTASGERFRPSKHTVAHRTLPFGTVLLVERGTRRVRVVVNDRGPYVDGRDLDLSKGAARALRMIDEGVSDVRYRPVGCRRAYEGPRACTRR